MNRPLQYLAVVLVALAVLVGGVLYPMWRGAIDRNDQQAIADVFGGKTAAKGAERFASGSWGSLSTSAPVLADGAGAIDCALEETIERFGVVIALGRVVDFALSSREPLILLRGKYVSAAPLMGPT